MRLVQGRQHPVEVFYTEAAEQSYLDAALMTVLQIHSAEGPGDVLVFLTGRDEIESMRELIHERWDSPLNAIQQTVGSWRVL